MDSNTENFVPAPNVSTNAVSTTPVSMDSSNPLFLHPSDSPNMILVNTNFDSRGYDGWKRALLIALSTKNKLGFINGTCGSPSADSTYLSLWNRCNDMVTSWILNSLSKEIVASVLYSKTAENLWIDLEDSFGQSNGVILFHLQKEISDLVQGTSDIAGYFTKIKLLWDELDALHTSLTSVCDSSCGGKSINLLQKTDLQGMSLRMNESISYSQAPQHHGWQQAMTFEFDALQANHTWTVMELYLRKRALAYKWVYTVKHHSDGTTERLKARLVERGDTRSKGVDFNETYSHVVKMIMIRCLLTIVVKNNLALTQLDVNNIFLHGNFHEEVFMKFPPGMSSSNPNHVLKLNKSLYGLRQTSREWYARLTTSLNYQRVLFFIE